MGVDITRSGYWRVRAWGNAGDQCWLLKLCITEGVQSSIDLVY